MKIHHYHPETGEYLGEGTADRDPLEPGRWLIPAHATTDSLPILPDGKSLYNINGVWVLRDNSTEETKELLEPVLTPTEKRATEIRGRLAQIDIMSVRPARAVSLALSLGNLPPENDVHYISVLETEAQSLRAELAELV